MNQELPQLVRSNEMIADRTVHSVLDDHNDFFCGIMGDNWKTDQIIEACNSFEELKTAILHVRQDINWMLNNRKFISAGCFGYLDSLIEKLNIESEP